MITCRSSLFLSGSKWFNIFSFKVTQEKSKEIRFAVIKNPILLKKINNQLTLPTYENIMQEHVSLAISCLYLFEQGAHGPMDQKVSSNH